MEPAQSENPKMVEMSTGSKELSFKLPVITTLNIHPSTNTSANENEMSIDYKSSLNMTKMQQRLTKVLQENVKLKETLRQNNEFTKQQFNILEGWQEKVTKVYQSHKQKFAENRELMNRLKKKSAELKTKLWSAHHAEDKEFEVISVVSESTINAATKQAELEQNHSYEDYVRTVKSLKYTVMCSAKDLEIASLKEFIALLEQKLQCVLNSIKLQDLERSKTSYLKRQKFLLNMRNDMLQEFFVPQRFVAKVGRCTAIEKSLLKEKITDKLDDDNSKMQCKKKLCQPCKQFTDEQIKSITDRQTLIKSQNQFQKIFSDYNSILCEMEIIIEENTKLNFQISEQLEQLEHIKCDKQLLEEEKIILDQEKINLEKEKEFLKSQKNSLDMERMLLQDEKKLLEQEKISLNEERMSLDNQSKLCDNRERNLLNEKKALQVRCKQLEEYIVEQNINLMDAEFQKMELAESAEEIQLLRSQLASYKEDLQQEKNQKELLLQEKNNLGTELQKQIKISQLFQKIVGVIYDNKSNVNSEQASESSINHPNEHPEVRSAVDLACINYGTPMTTLWRNAQGEPACDFCDLELNYSINRPSTTKKDSIQTRKRKPEGGRKSSDTLLSGNVAQCMNSNNNNVKLEPDIYGDLRMAYTDVLQVPHLSNFYARAAHNDWPTVDF